MKDYLNNVWGCRHFWFSLAKNDLYTRYRGSVLGLGWSLLNPIAMTIMLCAVFHKLFQIDIRDYAPFLLPGLAFWNFLNIVVLQGCSTMLQNETYIRQFPAPLAIYPLRTVIGAGIHFLLTLGVVLVLTAVVRGFEHPAALVSLPLSMALIAMFGWSLCVIFSFANVYFPDCKHLLEVALQLCFYGTPIIYPTDVLRSRGLSWVIDYNPLAAFVNLLRDPILDGRFPSVETLGLASLTVAITSTVAAYVLAKLQNDLIYHL
jgi:lipopolysaccharide transport system permease protein